jgi:hypothetical protein
LSFYSIEDITDAVVHRANDKLILMGDSLLYHGVNLIKEFPGFITHLTDAMLKL